MGPTENVEYENALAQGQLGGGRTLQRRDDEAGDMGVGEDGEAAARVLRRHGVCSKFAGLRAGRKSSAGRARRWWLGVAAAQAAPR